MQHHPMRVNAMRETSHHFSPDQLSPWHLEGDVWAHTMLVLQAYVGSAKVPDSCVGLTALLHDIGKPAAAKVLHHRQRVVFQGHESYSAWIAWGLLQDEALGLSRLEQCRIFSLIALHGCLYTGWFSDDASVRELQLTKAFSGFGQPFWHQLLAQIDHDSQGQITLNANNKTELQQLNQLLMQPEPITQSNTIPIVFFIGLPGSGKTTYRRHFVGYTIIARDDVLHQMTGESHYRKAWQRQEDEQLSPRIETELDRQFSQAVASNQPIVMDLTNLSRKARKRWLYQLPSHYQAQALIFITSEADIWQRNHQRQDKSLPNEVVHDMMLRFEHPLFDEFERIDYVVNGQVNCATSFL
jgi:predicted kinase